MQTTRTRLLGLVAAGSLSVAGLASIPVAHAHPAGHQQAAAYSTGATITVTLRSWLAQQTATGSQQLEVPYYPGVTPAAIAATAGFQGAALTSLMAIVDDRQVDLTAPLTVGDQLELITGMAGG